MRTYEPTCPFCNFVGLAACITTVHAAKCGRYKGLSFSYHWHHLPSGKRGINTQAFTSEADFHDKLAQWNAAQPEAYRYWKA